MRTPAGSECSFFYQDYFRGRALQKCQLPGIGSAWRPSFCTSCLVPGIQRANGCQDMVLRGEVHIRWMGLRKQVRAFAFCRRAERAVANPYIGCGICHADVLRSLALPPDEAP